jgi:hypothetical protein
LALKNRALGRRAFNQGRYRRHSRLLQNEKVIYHYGYKRISCKEKINIIKKTDDIIISFDGLKECHDANRGAGAYDKVLQTIQFLSDNKIKFFTITVLTKNNIGRENIDYILELSKNIIFLRLFRYCITMILSVPTIKIFCLHMKNILKY